MKIIIGCKHIRQQKAMPLWVHTDKYCCITHVAERYENAQNLYIICMGYNRYTDNNPLLVISHKESNIHQPFSNF